MRTSPFIWFAAAFLVTNAHADMTVVGCKDRDRTTVHTLRFDDSQSQKEVWVDEERYYQLPNKTYGPPREVEIMNSSTILVTKAEGSGSNQYYTHKMQLDRYAGTLKVTRFLGKREHITIYECERVEQRKF